MLTRAYDRMLTDFTKDPKATTGLLKTGDASLAEKTIDPAVLAAMTNVASTILCLDETVTKE